ncbi:RnfABCDGE type electron transport complex subunit G [Guggenheimella bovis]
MNKILKYGLLLCLFGALSALLLGVFNQITEGPIQEARLKAEMESRKQVFPEADNFEEMPNLEALQAGDTNILSAHKALKGAETIGYVIKTKANGFSGPVEVMIGAKVDGSINGVRIVNQTETPGVGDRSTKPEFYSQYEGKTLTSEIGVNKQAPQGNEIQAISGATVTSKAVTKAVNLAKGVLERIGK